MVGRDFEKDFGCMVIACIVFFMFVGAGIGIGIKLLIQYIF